MVALYWPDLSTCCLPCLACSPSSPLAVVTKKMIAASSVLDDGQMCWMGMVALYWLNLSTCCLSSLACSPGSPQAVGIAASSGQLDHVATNIAYRTDSLLTNLVQLFSYRPQSSPSVSTWTHL